MPKIRDTQEHGRTESEQELGGPLNERRINEVGNEARLADGSATEGAPQKGVKPELLAFEEGIRSRLGGSPEKLNEWILFSPFVQARIHAAARRFRWVDDVQDIAHEAIIALSESLDRPSSPLLRWDGRTGSGFWPAVFRNKVWKAVDARLRRRNCRRQVVVDQLACDRAEARADHITAERWAEVMDAADSLPEILRVVFKKHILEGFSRTRLAQELGLERHRIGKLLTTAIEEIMRLLNSDP